MSPYHTVSREAHILEKIKFYGFEPSKSHYMTPFNVKCHQESFKIHSKTVKKKLFLLRAFFEINFLKKIHS